MTRTPTSLSLLFALSLALAACGGSSTVDMGIVPIDAGMDTGADAGMPDLGGTDAGPPDMGIVYPPGTTCAMPADVTGSTVAPVSSTPVNTTMYPAGMRDLGFHCGNPDPGMGAGRFPPQIVIAYHVAGTGLQRVDMTTVNATTPMTFDTVIQVRSTCDLVPADQFPFSCFDDAAPGEVRSAGSITVMGGSTIYVFVTGYTNDMAGATTVDRGMVQVDFTQHDAHAPTATMLQSFFVGSHFELDGSGMDADGDAAGMIARLRNASGAPVDLNGDGTTDSFDDIVLPFGTSVAGMTTFSGSADVAELIAAGMAATGVITAAGATQAAVTIFDQGGLESAPMMGAIVTLPLVGVGAMCDSSNRCRLPATCDGTTMTCMLPPAIAAACMGAMAIAVATPTTTTTSATVTGSLAAGMGNFEGSCGQGGPATATPGTENLYTVDVPAGDFDLVVGTEMSSPATTDTLVYIRSDCGDPGTEVGCNDDINTAGMDYRSHVEVLDAPTGTYTIFAEHWGGGALPAYSLTASLRPVLTTGAACDGAGVMNRCAGGACPSSHVCP